jgi:hypothetical protein
MMPSTIRAVSHRDGMAVPAGLGTLLAGPESLAPEPGVQADLGASLIASLRMVHPGFSGKDD